MTKKYPYIKKHESGYWLVVWGDKQSQQEAFPTYRQAKKAYKRGILLRDLFNNDEMFMNPIIMCSNCGAELPIGVNECNVCCGY